MTGGCVASWSPHSLVSSDRPIREAVLVGKRVEAKVCNANILGFIPLDGHHLMAAVMDQLHETAPQAVAFQDIRFDESSTVFVLYNERCLVAYAQPVFPVPTIPPRARTRAPEAEPPAQPAPPAKTDSSDENKTPEQLEQELLGTPPTPSK